ncbi:MULTISPECIES: hypothetical protein [Desulfobacula]|uniref:Conserved uncharacterized protein associated with ABC transporter TOL2_12200 n=2 Tax=Desulfobacula TaxID=28222 RepID=K0NEC5_DESTT|nr:MULTISPECIES: hypothetical protein [Desulfobacula]CCK79386.1 conserved uncharacterized protein associated with ABC transporter TOL2_12200 [Desulfobacula toluolica Tol2]SDT84131.1 hypothetical protein SAMN04487931_101132 [Desulfobacula phenolica]
MSETEDQFPDSNMLDLRGKQSVRATFKLSQKAIDAIGLVAIHMGIKQKSLFDHIIEDMDALDSLAKTIRIRQFKKIPRKQKTFVLSRKTIDALGTISQAYGTPRDALVEYSVKKLESIINSEKLRHKERKVLQKEVINHFNRGKELYQKAVNILGKDDPFCRRIEKAVFACQKTEKDLALFIDKSKVLEDF